MTGDDSRLFVVCACAPGSGLPSQHARYDSTVAGPQTPSPPLVVELGSGTLDRVFGSEHLLNSLSLIMSPRSAFRPTPRRLKETGTARHPSRPRLSFYACMHFGHPFRTDTMACTCTGAAHSSHWSANTG